MNKTGSIIRYREKLEHNIFYKLLVLAKFRQQKRRIINSIDQSRFSKIREKYIDKAPPPGYSKYFDLDLWIMRNLWHVYILGLERSKQKKILDIGTGCGYFPFIAKYFGHEVKTIDIDGEPIFDEMISFFNIERLDYEVKEFRPFPELNDRFDVVTGFMVCFNNHKMENVWGVNEWKYFLTDLATNHLNENAEAFFTLNTEPSDNKWYSKALYDFFVASGAEVDGERIYYKNLSKFRKS
jgi:SAM-dependent methyltransferase